MRRHLPLPHHLQNISPPEAKKRKLSQNNGYGGSKSRTDESGFELSKEIAMTKELNRLVKQHIHGSGLNLLQMMLPSRNAGLLNCPPRAEPRLEVSGNNSAGVRHQAIMGGDNSLSTNARDLKSNNIVVINNSSSSSSDSEADKKGAPRGMHIWLIIFAQEIN